MDPSLPAVGQAERGFRVERVEPCPEQRATGILYAHGASGARLWRLAAPDPENLFAVAFRTPAPDNTGLPHILEHAALCGSRRYPVKDPFVELLKSSLATFLNAFTGSDHTVYPCASMNPADFLNLVRVYADAVFCPRLARDHFMQEGHHLAFRDPGDPASPLEVRGIVYNEMKGAYADLDGRVDRELPRTLFPDNAYGRDPGGDPEAIPDLSYGDFVAFHRAYYHPSEAFFFLYGDQPPGPVLDLLDREYLSGPALAGGEPRAVTAIAPQPRWRAPRSRTVPYPVEEARGGQAAVLLAWATNDARDAQTTLAMGILGTYLLDHAGSPLRKALVDSRLGAELAGYGYAAGQRDTHFSVGLKGTEADRAGAVADLVLSACRAEIARGLDGGQLASAFHQFEIAAREIGSSHPLRLMGRAYAHWLHGGDPALGLSVGRQLDALRARWDADPGLFARLLDEWLAGNPHRADLVFVPDPGLAAREAEALARRMEAVRARLSPAGREEVARAAARLEEAQGRPNPPEALATLPRLSLADIPAGPPPLEVSESREAGWTALRADLPSGGISYLELFVPLPLDPLEGPGGGGAAWLDWLPLYAECLGKTGAAGLDYAALARREAAVAGTLSASVEAVTSADCPGRAGLGLFWRLSALDRNWPAALEVLSDRWTRPDLGDAARLRDIVLQARTAARDSLVPSGASYARGRAAARISPAAALSERLHGLGAVRFLDGLADGWEARAPEAVAWLRAIHRRVAGLPAGLASWVGADGSRGALLDWLGRLPSAPGVPAFPWREGGEDGAGDAGGPLWPGPRPWPPAADWPCPPPDGHRTGFAVPSEVAFVAQAAPAPPLSDAAGPALLLLETQLSYGYLWNEARAKGGAYGCYASYAPGDGVVSAASFRDPRIARTLEVYKGIGPHVEREMDLSPGGLGQAVIGTFKKLDAPWRPARACAAVLRRRLSGMDAARRRDVRRRLREVTADQVRAAARRCFGEGGLAGEGAPVCVLAGGARLEAENRSAGLGLALSPA